jgi:long-chain acyl-CoA synthetase
MPYPAMSVAQVHAILTGPGGPLEIETKTIRGQDMRVYKVGPQNLRDIFDLSRTHGDLDFIVYEDERISYRAHANAAAKLAGILRDTYGVKKGDRVALVMRNLPEWPVVFWASVIIGAMICPLNAWWTADELEYGLRDCGAIVAIVDVERSDRITEKLPLIPNLKTIIVARSGDDLPAGAVALESLIGPAASWASLPETSAPDVALDPEDLCTLFYTSGTTGAPKGAYGTHRNVITNLLNMMVNTARQFLRRGETPPAPDPSAPKKASLLAIPLFHVTGCHAVLVPSVAQGAKIVMMHRWDALKGIELIEREKINAFGGVPAIAWQVIEHPRLSEFDTSSVETVSYGGAPSSAELVRKIVATFPKVSPGQGYGLTETSAAVTNIGSEDYENRPLSCGPAHPINDVRVVDGSGNDVPVGEIGELWIRGPNVIVGYWNKPEATEAAFGGGWFKSGDLVRMDEEGFIFIVDRAKDMIIRGGENVYCSEIEDVLYTHPEISDAAIVGVPHKILGEEVGAVVTVPPGSTLSVEDVRRHVGAKLASFKVPAHVRIMYEPLLRNANGKILKRELKALFEDTHVA